MTDAAAKLQQELKEERQELRRDVLLTGLTGVGLILAVVFQIADSAPWLPQGAFLLAYCAGGIPAGISAIREVFKGKLDIDLLMVLAALAAAAVGEARDGAILLFLFSLAGTLESYAMGNTKRAVVSLMQLRPDEANLQRQDGQLERVSVESLNPGDSVIVRPGERIPIDAIITSGSSAIDQSPVTGESVPVDKTQGDAVFAGTVNGYGVLELKVSKRASESTLARMINLVTEAQESKAPSERFSNWFGQRYTVFVLLGTALALLVFILIGLPRDEALYKAATLLVVASPCAIVISVPAAILSALAAAARRGVLFKGGAALEDFGSSKVIAFDKTGTLTQGIMVVNAVVALRGSEAELLSLAAALESHSEHPVAQSILRYAAEQGIGADAVSDSTAIPGMGIVATIGGDSYWAGNRKLAEAQGVRLGASTLNEIDRLESAGNTTIMIGAHEVVGLIAVADAIRPSASEALSSLRAAGLQRFVMLTGDHPTVAHAVAKTLGIPKDDVYAELLPEDKVRLVRELSQNADVAFVGDGVNDAAALASARVGVAMGTAGSDVALEAADVALLSDDLRKLTESYSLARRANRIIRQNLAFALSIMIVMVVVTLFWHLPLPLGVIGHEGGTLLVVANGLRLLVGSQRGS